MLTFLTNSMQTQSFLKLVTTYHLILMKLQGNYLLNYWKVKVWIMTMGKRVTKSYYMPKIKMVKEDNHWVKINYINTSLMPCPSMGPKCFWTVPIILVEYQLFWTGPICFGQVQIIIISLIWTWPKRFGHDQNNLYLSKTNWMVQCHFGLIEGQGINS